MSASLKEIKGVSDSLYDKLAAKGINTSDEFLGVSKTPAARRALATETGEDEKLILEIANRCDLTRLKGVAGVYSDLLENAGVDTVKELARRNAENLHAKVTEINESLQLTQRPMTLNLITDIIEQAKTMAPGLEY